LAAAALAAAAACSDEAPAPAAVPLPPAPQGVQAIYVLNEGLLGTNTCTLGRYDFARRALDPDFFRTANGRSLGDTGNDMQQYGGKLYCAVSVSSRVEVVEAATGASVGSIPLFDEGGLPCQPRAFAFWEGKAYVALFSGAVACIDTATLRLEATVRVGRNPDGICATRGKLYVSNSGGLDFPRYDSTVSVVDIASLRELKRIAVGANPYTIAADAWGDVYVATRGNYGAQDYNLHRIDAGADTLAQTFGIPALSFAVAGGYAYLYRYDFARGEAWLKVLNLQTEQLERESFITDGTALRAPNGLAVGRSSGCLFVAEADPTFTGEGQLLCFSPAGALLWRLPAGLNPKAIAVIEQ
jgi:hypothetical protein